MPTHNQKPQQNSAGEIPTNFKDVFEPVKIAGQRLRMAYEQASPTIMQLKQDLDSFAQMTDKLNSLHIKERQQQVSRKEIVALIDKMMECRKRINKNLNELNGPLHKAVVNYEQAAKHAEVKLNDLERRTMSLNSDPQLKVKQMAAYRNARIMLRSSIDTHQKHKGSDGKPVAMLIEERELNKRAEEAVKKVAELGSKILSEVSATPRAQASEVTKKPAAATLFNQEARKPLVRIETAKHRLGTENKQRAANASSSPDAILKQTRARIEAAKQRAAAANNQATNSKAQMATSPAKRSSATLFDADQSKKRIAEIRERVERAKKIADKALAGTKKPKPSK